MSVFGKAGVTTQVLEGTVLPATVAPQVTTTLPAQVFKSAPAPVGGNIMQLTTVTDADIDKIGDSVSRDIGATTQKIIEKMGVGKFDDLGAILTSIQQEVDKLDPASIQKGGIVGWMQRTFGDVKAQLTLRLKSAQEVFKGLEDKISQHITVQQEWVNDLENLYMENYRHYTRILQESKDVEALIAYVEAEVKSWPEVDLNDPTAAMQVQCIRDAEGKINRLRLKLDNLTRLKAMTEINSPKIRQQQDTSRTTISTLKDVIAQTIPIVKMEFAMFLQTLDVQKSVSLTNEVRNLATKTLTKGADGAKVAALESAKAMNTPVITTETLQHLRTSMLETVTGLKKIEAETQARIAADAVTIQEGQKSLLTALKESGKI